MRHTITKLGAISLPAFFLTVLGLLIPDAAIVPAAAWMLVGVILVMSGAVAVTVLSAEREEARKRNGQASS